MPESTTKPAMTTLLTNATMTQTRKKTTPDKITTAKPTTKPKPKATTNGMSGL